MSAGARATLYVPFGAHPNIQISLIGEYTLSSDGYTPRYFTALYDSERFATQIGPGAQPKALTTIHGGSGGRLGLEVDVPHLARFAAFGELRPSPYDGDFFFTFNLPVTRWVRAGALFLQRQIRDGRDLFSNRALWLLSAEIAVRIADNWNAYGQLGHTYRLFNGFLRRWGLPPAPIQQLPAAARVGLWLCSVVIKRLGLVKNRIKDIERNFDLGALTTRQT